MSTQKYRRMRGPSPQRARIGLEQSDFIIVKLERLVELDEVAAAIKFPPLVIVFGTQTVRLDREVSGRNVFAAAEIQLSDRIHPRYISDSKVNGTCVNLMLLAQNSFYVCDSLVAAQKFHP